MTEKCSSQCTHSMELAKKIWQGYERKLTDIQ